MGRRPLLTYMVAQLTKRPHIVTTGEPRWWYKCKDAASCSIDAKQRTADEQGHEPFVNRKTKAAWDDLPSGWHCQLHEENGAFFYWHEDNPVAVGWDHPTIDWNAAQEPSINLDSAPKK